MIEDCEILKVDFDDVRLSSRSSGVDDKGAADAVEKGARHLRAFVNVSVQGEEWLVVVELTPQHPAA